MIGRVNFHLHNRFKQRGLGLLHRFLKSKRAGDLEGHVRRIHVVIFPVVQNGPEVRHRESRKIPARSRVTDTPFHRRNPVLRDGASEDIVHELDAFAALDRLHFDAAHTELSVPAGLFLMLAFGVGFPADGFAVRHFGRLQREIDVVALVELGHDDFDVLLAGTGEEKFLGLRIARKAQRGVLFQDFVDGDADFVFIGAAFRFNRKSNGGFG